VFLIYKNSKMKTLLTLFSIAIGYLNIHAQTKPDSAKTFPVQFSIIPPLSTNGISNSNQVNNLSINLLAGYSGGINGFEMGGFANIVKNKVVGTQMAGFANVVGGETKGIQMAGFCNVNQKSVQGIQTAGFTNVVSDSIDALQLAGFANIVSGTSTGCQGAGFLNITTATFNGAQLAGFMNFAGENLTGGQIAGFYNQTIDTTNGAQVAGFMNLSNDLVQGAQISGFLNVTKRLRGTQLGFINLCDSLESGAPFGFLSIIRKGGFMAFELSADETFYGVAQWKTGGNMLYNIFNISVRPGNTTYWGWGYGFGSNLKSTGKFRINLDLTVTHVNENSLWTNHLNLLSRAKLGFTWQAAKHLAISAGPTFNVLVRKSHPFDGTPGFSNLPPYKSVSKFQNNTQTIMWPGAHLSLRF
jgi:hypothetical protein